MINFIEHKREISCGGSSWCTHCGKAWDTGDRDPPSCKPPAYDKRFQKIMLEKVEQMLETIESEEYLQTVAEILKNKRQYLASPTPTHIALIGFLAAKLACYEPDSHTVKRAMEYLSVRS